MEPPEDTEPPEESVAWDQLAELKRVKEVVPVTGELLEIAQRNRNGHQHKAAGRQVRSADVSAGPWAGCCTPGPHGCTEGCRYPDALEEGRAESEEEIDHAFQFVPNARGKPLVQKDSTAEEEPGPAVPAAADAVAEEGVRWSVVRSVAVSVAMLFTLVFSLFVQGWQDGEAFSASFESMLRYGSIPIVAAVIGYGTNVVALQMMFYPLEFIGCFPEAKIGCGLDLPLFGWQGVIPMRARAMAEISVELMTQKLIKVDEVFSKLSPARVAQEVAPALPEVIRQVVEQAGRTHLPKLWEHAPPGIKQQLEERITADSKPMMANFIRDLQINIEGVFDLKTCVVERLLTNKHILNEMFLSCGDEEFEFIRISGFYLGFAFGLLQMCFWIFIKSWWILPLCGVFVGWFTNVIALKVIFMPVEPTEVFNGRYTVHGLFLQRQKEVSALYAREVAKKILSAHVLMTSLVSGPRKEAMHKLVDRHVEACVEAQASQFKQFFLLAIGAEAWISFRDGVKKEFREKLPKLLGCIEAYADEAMELQETLQDRLEKLSSSEFERLLHAVFEQDEIKLILVGALLGFVVGFVQAVIQTPEQLGLA